MDKSEAINFVVDILTEKMVGIKGRADYLWRQYDDLMDLARTSDRTRIREAYGAEADDVAILAANTDSEAEQIEEVINTLRGL